MWSPQRSVVRVDTNQIRTESTVKRWTLVQTSKTKMLEFDVVVLSHLLFARSVFEIFAAIRKKMEVNRIRWKHILLPQGID